MSRFILLLVISWSRLSLGSTAGPEFKIEHDLVDIGLTVFDLSRVEAEREAALSRYLEHPRMLHAFARYSNARRPPENRVSAAIYQDFVRKLWRHASPEITHPRMKWIAPHYDWGIQHIQELRNDLAIVQRSIDDWLEQAVRHIPFGTSAAVAGKKPVVLVFLFDPGGSYPWVEEDSRYRYVYFDILQLRGLNNKEREAGFSPDVFVGFLTHELFHLYQNDQFIGQTRADWLIQSAVSEGAASLIGNNAFGRNGQRFRPNQPTLLTGALREEWQAHMPRVCDRIHAFVGLHREWTAKQPRDEEYYQVIARDGWVATPENQLLMGDIYRVGAQMLFDIKTTQGKAAFLRVLSNSSLLISTWSSAATCTSKDS